MNILIPIYTYTKDEIKNFPSWVNGGNSYGRRKMGIQLNQKERSKTFYGVAQAMADQWG